MHRIREIREDKNLTQKELAEKIGVVGHNVGDWERGKCEPSLNMLVKIASALEVSIDYLLGLEDDFGNVNVVSAGETVELSEDERTLLSCFEVLGPFEREAILIQIKALAGNIKDAPRSMRKIKVK